MEQSFNQLKSIIQLTLSNEEDAHAQEEQALIQDMNGMIITPKPKKKSQKQIFYIFKENKK